MNSIVVCIWLWLRVHTLQPNSVQLLSSVWLWPHGMQHTRPPCPSPTPGACSNSCPLSRWCHPTISPSVVPFSFCLHLSSIRDFSNESLLCIRWPNYWSFSFSISPSNDFWLLSHVQFFATPWTIAHCSLPVSSVHEIVQASILERVNIPFSRGFFEPRSTALQEDSLPSEPPRLINFFNQNTFLLCHQICSIIYILLLLLR